MLTPDRVLRNPLEVRALDVYIHMGRAFNGAPKLSAELMAAVSLSYEHLSAWHDTALRRTLEECVSRAPAAVDAVELVLSLARRSLSSAGRKDRDRRVRKLELVKKSLRSFKAVATAVSPFVFPAEATMQALVSVREHIHLAAYSRCEETWMSVFFCELGSVADAQEFAHAAALAIYDSASHCAETAEDKVKLEAGLAPAKAALTRLEALLLLQSEEG